MPSRSSKHRMLPTLMAAAALSCSSATPDRPPSPPPTAAGSTAANSGSSAPAPPVAGAGGATSAAGHGDAGATPSPPQSATPIAAPPSYLGTDGSSSACTKSWRTIGFAPTSGSGHPLFLYFVGTKFVSADESAYYDSLAAKAVTEAMARRGFVALSVEYDNQISAALTNKLPCLFEATQAQSLLAQACAQPNVDCSQGIASWGHSQGALLAHTAANYDARVRAVWATGYGGIGNHALPNDRLRVVNGEADTMNANVSTLNTTTGLTSSDCPDDGRTECLRADGSGWVIVRKNACKVTAADHCWFDKRSCVENAETLEPAWTDPASDAPFALERNADWVAATVARP